MVYEQDLDTRNYESFQLLYIKFDGFLALERTYCQKFPSLTWSELTVYDFYIFFYFFPF